MTRKLAVACLMLAVIGPAFAVETRHAQQEHQHETPAAKTASRQQHRNGAPDRTDATPGGSYAPADTASSSGKPPVAVPKR